MRIYLGLSRCARKTRRRGVQVAKIIEGKEAEALSRKAKWELLSPYLTKHGFGCMAYSTLQDGMDYFIVEGVGYIAYYTVGHPVLVPRGRRLVLGDPIAPVSEYSRMIREFMKDGRHAIFYQVSRECACALHEELKLKVNEMGVEWDLDVPSYDLKGKDKAQVRRWINKAKSEGVEAFEQKIGEMEPELVKSVSNDWLKRKGGEEAKFVTRPLVLEDEPDVRYFWAKKDGKLIGMTVFDPLYHDGKVTGYYHNIARTSEEAPHGSSDLMNLAALEKFKGEGVSILTLGLSPLSKLEDKDLAYRKSLQVIFRFMREHCEHIYPFKGNYFHKSRYGGRERRAYIANSSGGVIVDPLLFVHGVGMSLLPV